MEQRPKKNSARPVFSVQSVILPAHEKMALRRMLWNCYGTILYLSSSVILSKGLKNLLTGGLKPALYQDSSMCAGNNVRV